MYDLRKNILGPCKNNEVIMIVERRKMIQIICFLSPAFLAVTIFEKNRDVILTKKEFITVYFVLASLINFLCLSVVAVVFHHRDYIVSGDIFNMGFTFKYLLLGLSLAVLLPEIYEKGKQYIKLLWRFVKLQIRRKSK